MTGLSSETLNNEVLACLFTRTVIPRRIAVHPSRPLNIEEFLARIAV